MSDNWNVTDHWPQKVKKVKGRSSSILIVTPMTGIWDANCHVGSHSVTCYPTQVNTLRVNSGPQAGTGFTYPKGWKAKLLYEKFSPNENTHSDRDL